MKVVSAGSGLGYLAYDNYARRNVVIEDVMERGELQKYLLDLHQQMAYSIDETMDGFEQTYNQYNIMNYRKTLISQAAGKVHKNGFIFSSRHKACKHSTCYVFSSALTGQI